MSGVAQFRKRCMNRPTADLLSSCVLLGSIINDETILWHYQYATEELQILLNAILRPPTILEKKMIDQVEMNPKYLYETILDHLRRKRRSWVPHRQPNVHILLIPGLVPRRATQLKYTWNLILDGSWYRSLADLKDDTARFLSALGTVRARSMKFQFFSQKKD